MTIEDYPLVEGPLKLLDVRVMHGANYFSGGQVLIFRVDLGEYDEVFSNEINDFAERLEHTLPSLIEHQCSEGERGGFLKRVREGTLLGHITEHVAIELQTLAGMDVGYGKTRRTSDPGVYNVVFRFMDEVAGEMAGRAALNLVNSLLGGESFDADPIIHRLVEIREERLLGPSTQAIVDEASARGIPCLRLDRYNLVQLGTGRYHRRIRATITSTTGTIAAETADDKRLTNRMLADAGVPVPETLLTDKLDEVLSFRQRLNSAMVIKPCEGYLGRGVSTEVNSPDEVAAAMAWARTPPWGTATDPVLVQTQANGDTFRFLVIDFKVVAAARLLPPVVTGDGGSSLAELVQQLNSDPRRGPGDKAILSLADTDETTAKILSKRGYGLASVLPAGETVALQISPSLRLGGSAEDVTDQVHPQTRFLVERAARVIGLDVAGVDVVAADTTTPLDRNGGVVIDVNAAPDFRPHLHPTEGRRRNVAKPLVDMLFPVDTTTRVPLFSVTGTAGKTTAVNLIAHCLKVVGHTVGLTTTEGLFVADTCLMAGDMTYPEQVALVLRDPTIDSAVLETSREGILRRGLGYELADVGVVLNIHDDHVGADDISRLDDLAYAKSVVAERVYDDGAAVLNADNDLVMEMSSRVYSRLLLFSRKRSNKEIVKHTEAGETAVVVDGRHVVVLKGQRKTEVLHLEDIPLTLAGRAELNLDAVLAGTAALVAFGLPMEALRRGLATFNPDPVALPGRMNLLEVRDFEVLVDYAHNHVGFGGVQAFLQHHVGRKIGVFDAPGDRSDEQILALAGIAAATYDEVVLYEDPDRRGRKPQEITDLLRRGLEAAGFDSNKITVCASPEEAWTSALERGVKGTMVVILTERSRAALETVARFA